MRDKDVSSETDTNHRISECNEEYLSTPAKTINPETENNTETVVVEEEYFQFTKQN